ncbi:uncharacterized protein BJ171DRAFT_499818 [Polychytrium aggregatum]|uniref:uncharacterized protein n=1 Tax=Polychytrium aggregatum TaxID=110093 RepID=UPI0022FE46EE|nr:uncharacterized protein BJ171DRAFT_499818 [Polychytrium aggregatum]KAI9205823.1 hypothetical protein BJ171DRAFT_499818 [Polychytrium aggregatum]
MSALFDQNPYQSYSAGGQEDSLQFTQFSYGEPSGASYSSSYAHSIQQQSYNQASRMHSSSPSEFDWRSAFGTGGLAGEPPLLEELGINFEHIKNKSLTVLNPFTNVDQHIMDDTDLAGPLIFLGLFGGFLLLSGKLHFGYIYGVAMLGCASMYVILNLMSTDGIDVSRATSVLGYCLLPMVLLSSSTALLQLSGFGLGIIGFALTCVSVLWCTYSASLMFVTVLRMKEQQLLVAYPVGLLYSAFALLAML